MSKDYRKLSGKNANNYNSSKSTRQEHNFVRPDFSRKYREIEDPYGMDIIERRKGPGPRTASQYVSRADYSSRQSNQSASTGYRPKKQRKPAVTTRPQEDVSVIRERVAANVGRGPEHIQRPVRPGTLAGRSSYTIVDDDRETGYVEDKQALDTQAVARKSFFTRRRIIALAVVAGLLFTGLISLCIMMVVGSMSSDVKTVQFWADCTNDPDMEKYLEDVVAQYNRQQNEVKVELKTKFNDYTATITYRYREKTKPSTGSAPDINLVYGHTMQDMLQIGNIYDLSQSMMDAGYNYSAMFEGLMIHNVNVSGEAVYALPYMVNTYATVYNVDLFKAIGVEEEDIPCTVEGLIAMNNRFNALSSENNKIYGFTLPTDDPTQWLFTITQIGKAHGVTTFDYSTLTRRYSVLTDLVTQLTDSSKMSLTGVGTYEEMVEKFAKGQIAAMVVDYNTLREKLSQEKSRFTVKTTRILEYLPFVQPQSADLYDVTYIEINKSSTCREEAFDFLMYLLNNENMSQLYKDTGNIPASWNAMEYQPPTDESLIAYFDFDNQIRLPEPMGNATEGMTVGEIYMQIRDGLLTPSDALITLEQQENESIKQALKTERIKADDYTIYYNLYGK